MTRLAALALLVPAVSMAAPTTLSSQGRLIDSAGTPINGDHTLTFSIYTDEAASSAALWTEDHDVSVSDGYYAVVLGGDTSFPTTVLTANSVFLGVSVDSAADLRPREPVTSSMYAMRADTAVNVDGGTVNATTIGANQVTVGDFVLDASGLSADGEVVVDANGLVTTADWDTVTAIVTQQHYAQPDLVAMDLPGSQAPGSPLNGYAHRSVSTGVNNCYNWARTTPQPIDSSQNYEFSIWVQSDAADMDNYFGFHVYDENMDRITTGGMDNPYFKSGENDSGWTRWTGQLLHHGTTSSTISTTNGTDFVMPANAAYVSMRYGACYSETAGATSDFALPGFIQLETPPISNVQTDTSTRNFGTGWAVGRTFSTVNGFRAGSKVRMSYHVPMRNDSGSWGGGYIEPQIRFNGGTWQSLGSSGYDGGVMNTGASSIGSYSNTLLIDPGMTTDFSVQTRFYHRSYDSTVVVNGSHDINSVSGTASVMSSTNGAQHYTNVVLEEVR